jgi:Xaa-Pro aminopeptidase
MAKRSRPLTGCYIGFMIEGYQDAHERLWVPSVANVSHGSRDAVEHAIRHIEAEEAGVAAIGIERSFLPMDAYEALRAGLHGVRFVDCTEMLEELRERKRDDELVAKLATAMGEHHQPALAALLFDDGRSDGLALAFRKVKQRRGRRSHAGARMLFVHSDGRGEERSPPLGRDG